MSRTAHGLLLIALLLAGMLVGCQSGGGDAGAMQRFRDKPLPELDVPEWVNTDGKPISIESLRGKAVVIEFWATWCPPCVQAVPHLVELHNKHAREGLAIVSIHARRGADVRNVKEFTRKNRVEYPVGLDKEGAVIEAYGVDGIPEAFVLDRQGRLLWAGHPADEGFDRAVKLALESQPQGKQ